MDKARQKKVGTQTIKTAKWIIPEGQQIIYANAYRFVYSPLGITLVVGLIDPEHTTVEYMDSAESIPVKSIARYFLTLEDFNRLKKELLQADTGLAKALEKNGDDKDK